MATNNNLNFSVLGHGGSDKGTARRKKGDLPCNLAVRLDKIELGQAGKPSFFSGFQVGSNEPVRIRMMTLPEGYEVNARKDEPLESVKKRVDKMYIGDGEAHRPKPAEVANASNKAYCATGGLLLFTKCLKNEDGTYRAHWVETMEREPGAGCDVVTAHLRVRETTTGQDQRKITQVYADIVNPAAATVLDKDNMVAALSSAFANQIGEEKRRPFAVVRLIDASNGAILLSPYRVDAKYKEQKELDGDTGAEFSVFHADTPEESIKNLFNPENVDRTDLLAVRAALHGLGSADGYPDFSRVTEAALKDDLARLTDAVRTGGVKVEIIPGERIAAGPATKASFIKAVNNNPRHPVHNYLQKDDNDRIVATRFTATFLTTKTGPNGYRYFTKAVPVDLYPKMSTLKTLATANDVKATAEAAQARAADAAADERVLPVDAEPVDPSSFDTAPQDSIEAKLAEAGDALSATELGYE